MPIRAGPNSLGGSRVQEGYVNEANAGAEVDVVVVGCGNAALCAAAAAQQAGASVVVLERAPQSKMGGNGAFTGGLVRFAYDGLEALVHLADLTPEESKKLDLTPYTANDLFDDVASLGDYLGDPDLLHALASRSYDTMLWLKSLGVKFLPAFGMHATEFEGKIRFRGNAPIEISGGGLGLVTHLARVFEREGGAIWYSSRAIGLEAVSGNWRLTVKTPAGLRTANAVSVILACGGFEANASMRAQYLGPGWDLARVRGTEFNTGDGHRLAAEVGADLVGHWSGCHATPTDSGSPRVGDRKFLHTFERHSYNFGIMVNSAGVRFVDEGMDFETHTYAKFGREILVQPGGLAYQIFDSSVTQLLRSEYWKPVATKIEADSIMELGARLGLPDQFVSTVESFNESVSEGEFNPTTLDGKTTRGIHPRKSNWAIPIQKPPFFAFPVVCGITFTYGGLRISTDANVLSEDGSEIPGLFAAGEIVGGLFYQNYPTATGITAGAVFGRAAGVAAAQHALGSKTNSV
jgi:tricarballylate dehydrogenase